MTRHLDPQELFQAVEFYNNGGVKVITRERYQAIRGLLEQQKVFEITDKCDTGVVYIERCDDQDMPANYYAIWFVGSQFEEEVHMSFCLRAGTPHQALDCVVEQMKVDSEGEQQEAVEANT